VVKTFALELYIWKDDSFDNDVGKSFTQF